MIQIRDEQFGSYFREFKQQFLGVKITKFFDADPGWKKFRSGMENFGSGIRDGESSAKMS
jgi:hypothetical protein